MAVSVATFKSVFDEFADVADAKVQYWLDQASAELDFDRLKTCLGTRFDHVVYLLTAHFLSKPGSGAGGGADSGTVASERAGDLAISYANNAAGTWQEGLKSTQYGQEYLRAMEACTIHPMVI